MKRLLLLTILIGSLFSVPNSFAQSSKPKRATIKYENGVKYVGEIRKGSPKKYSEYALIQKVFIGRKKLKHGKGIMYFANGDQLDGEWNNDQCKRGTYKFANGDVFEGEISVIYTQKGMIGPGTMIFASEGDITLGYKTWHYPANCSFTGTIKDKKPYTGSFDCTLTTEDGDRFTGRLSDGHFNYGKIEYANGDSFEGSFISDAPSSGKYRYGSITEITRANHKWEIPTGCVFEGNIVPFTGTVNMEITNTAGDKFVGKLNNGAPDEGTMVFAATGHTETGKWQDGLSPREYQIQQRAKERARDSITKAFVAQQRINDAILDKRDLKNFEDYMTKHDYFAIHWDGITGSILHGASIKLAQLYTGKKIIYKDDICVCRKIEYITANNRIKFTISTSNGNDKILYLKRLSYYDYPQQRNFNYPDSFTYRYYNCGVVEDTELLKSHLESWVSTDLYLASDIETAKNRAKNYYINQYGNKYGTAVLNRKIELGMTVEMVQAIKGKGDISQYVSEGRKITILSYGGVRNALIATVVSPVNTYTFVNGRLTEYTTNEGQGTVIWN